MHCADVITTARAVEAMEVLDCPRGYWQAIATAVRGSRIGLCDCHPAMMESSARMSCAC